MVFLSLLAMVLFAMKQSGLLFSDSGQFAVIDGDSLRKDGAEFRLHAIDAPELNQTCTSASGTEYACGREARDELRHLVSGAKLDCRVTDTDRYGRAVAICSAGHAEINAEMVRSGWALAYRSHGLDYVAEEDAARAARLGIWQGRFERPEDWRRRQRSRMMQSSMGEDPPPD